ncbi:MAG TPA: hemerythrin domain-containing protein [Noviherbaspirillum sp.]|uniref:hemerythrin domain-containing protein n=1 Tax=Noviherbaspirillum sp. TaxID=1926288 RepID=UPI002D6A70BE|nr:hemerythrin domain-containing protein [Noviherbaspirillum sp.]HYD96807.1 hemerythrin domain-containing protein [Noviherbaspirillum sp.]
MNEQELDAVPLLTKQHREMEQLLRQVADADDDAHKKTLFEQAADQLTVHIKSEEEIFYPAVHRARTEDDLLESLEEHLSLKRLLADLLELDPSEKSFEAKFKVLKEQTEHHHKEEEEHLFPAVLKLLDQPTRAALGRDMLTRQADLTQQGEPRDAMPSETDVAAALPPQGAQTIPAGAR